MDDGLRERLKAAAEWLENRRAETLQDEITFKLMAKDVRHTLNAIAALEAAVAAAEKRTELAKRERDAAKSLMIQPDGRELGAWHFTGWGDLGHPSGWVTTHAYAFTREEAERRVERMIRVAAGLAPADEPAGPGEGAR
jgi:hypothetical protein